MERPFGFHLLLLLPTRNAFLVPKKPAWWMASQTLKLFTLACHASSIAPGSRKVKADDDAVNRPDTVVAS
jgi:hypothetical protein